MTCFGGLVNQLCFVVVFLVSLLLLLLCCCAVVVIADVALVVLLVVELLLSRRKNRCTAVVYKIITKVDSEEKYPREHTIQESTHSNNFSM